MQPKYILSLIKIIGQSAVKIKQCIEGKGENVSVQGDKPESAEDYNKRAGLIVPWPSLCGRLLLTRCSQHLEISPCNIVSDVVR